jgi:ribosome biogenesis GTPase / thiamine phosphate phosphatase
MAKKQIQGTIIRQHLAHYIVAAETGQLTCALSSRLRKNLQYPEADAGSRRQRVQSVRRLQVVDPVAIGDRVVVDLGDDHHGMITEILPRKSKISRRASGGSKKEQLIATNIDQVMPIFTLAKPDPDWRLLDRMLAIAEWQEIPLVICFNKMDLVTETRALGETEIYRTIGYRTLFTSTVDDTGKEAFRESLQNHTTLFMGSSGVGKTSLLNWLQPGLKLRTGEISESSGDGRHTTTHTELVGLDAGGFVGDIPGVREFNLFGIQASDTPHLFREFFPFLGSCRFRDCSHTAEPGCAIKTAVEEGDITRPRYLSFLSIRSSLE